MLTNIGKSVQEILKTLDQMLETLIWNPNCYNCSFSVDPGEDQQRLKQPLHDRMTRNFVTSIYALLLYTVASVFDFSAMRQTIKKKKKKRKKKKKKSSNRYIIALYRPIFQLFEGSTWAFAFKVKYLNNYKRYHHDRHIVGKVFSLCIRRQKV